ncbi:MAG: endonuclease/exonuclease/phosphatase family protein [Phycisphaeraceae bacterium]|nr:endonuclease/exonuclease/phosphatase family protein [Phycisphaeraceae bacterium]
MSTLILVSSAIVFANVIPSAWIESSAPRGLLGAASFFVLTFEPHLGIVAALAIIGLLVLRNWRVAVIAAPLLGWTLGPMAWSLMRPSPSPIRSPLHIMTANLLVGHDGVDVLARRIIELNPDVIFFQEYTPAKARRLIPLLAGRYPNVAEGLRDHAFGSAIYSRFPFLEVPDLYPHRSIRAPNGLEGRIGGEVGVWDPQVRAIIEHDGEPIVLQNVHFAPPIHLQYFAEQRAMTRWLCDWLKSETRAVVIAGDFNSTDRSDNLRELAAAGALDTAGIAGRGWIGTWPSSGLAGLVPMPIDHILVRGLRCSAARVGGDIASDHLPLFAEIGR